MSHLELEHFIAALRGKLPFLLLHQQAHRHLVAVCGACRKAWRKRPTAKACAPAASPEPAVPPSVEPDPRAAAPESLERTVRLLAQARLRARRAREDLARLERLPPERWPELIETSRTRFRSRGFAELLIEEARRRVRTAPPEAEALAGLVPRVLARRPGREACGWARVLATRAAAYRANALRVAGDLPAAERAFALLRRGHALTLVRDPAAAAEVASLEASLRIGQRQLDRAAALLDAAAAVYRHRGGALPLARVLLQQSNLHQAYGQPEEMLAPLAEAARLLDAAAEPYLYFCTVHGRVNALLDLDRPGEAGELLAAERAAYLASGDAHTVALHGAMQARVDLGLGRLAAAEAGFASARDRLLALDRDYDAILACLYLADTLLAAGKTADLARLAAELVPLFRSRGVERETLAAIRLLAEAAKGERLSAAVVEEVRRRLDPAARPATSPVDP
jgi:hypothetical protein